MRCLFQQFWLDASWMLLEQALWKKLDLFPIVTAMRRGPRESSSCLLVDESALNNAEG